MRNSYRGMVTTPPGGLVNFALTPRPNISVGDDDVVAEHNVLPALRPMNKWAIDSAVKMLTDNAKALRQTKRRQSGELIVATGADATDIETLAGVARLGADGQHRAKADLKETR